MQAVWRITLLTMYRSPQSHNSQFKLVAKSDHTLQSGLTSQSGFTLIELIVAISIMMLLLGSGIVSYLTFNDRQGLLSGMSEVKSLLRTAQTRARLGDRPEGCDRLLYYEVRIPVESSTASLIAECENGAYTRSEITLSANTRAVNLVAVQFKVLHGGVINPGAVTLETAQGLTYVFDVTEGGEVTAGALVE